MEPIGCSETSVRIYHYSLRNDPEERISHLLRGGSVKSRNSRRCQYHRHQTITLVPGPWTLNPQAAASSALHYIQYLLSSWLPATCIVFLYRFCWLPYIGRSSVQQTNI